MPTVFASVSMTILLFYGATLALAYAHLFPEFHMLWGLFTATLIILLQCLVFGFFIGSGKSIKQKVQEHGLSQDWVQKTKDYKNRAYPPLMLAIVFSVTAAVLGGSTAVGASPIWIHQIFVWLALLLNIRSLWISYKVVGENVEAIHRMNAEIRDLNQAMPATAPVEVSPRPEAAVSKGQPWSTANFYFLAAAVWVPYLYMKFSLGSRNFPFWPFLALSGLCLLLGWLKGGKKSS